MGKFKPYIRAGNIIIIASFFAALTLLIVISYLRASAKKDQSATLTFINAVRKGDRSLVKQLLDSGVNPNAVDPSDEDQATALMVAGMAGQTNIGRLLLEKGASVEGKSKTGGT